MDIPPKLWTVYILYCNNRTYYTGCSGNFTKRLQQHQNGEVFSTKNKLPVRVVLKIVFPSKTKAFQFEKYLKSGSGIAFRNKRFL